MYASVRIRINKQLDVEPDEPPSPVESEGEGGQPKPPRRKPKRVRKEGSLAEAMEDTIRDADLTVEPVPLPKTSPDILMVEVDNVQHEEFQITEEVKVLAFHKMIRHVRQAYLILILYK